MSAPRFTVMVLPVHRAGVGSSPAAGRLICNYVRAPTFRHRANPQVRKRILGCVRRGGGWTAWRIANAKRVATEFVGLAAPRSLRESDIKGGRFALAYAAHGDRHLGELARERAGDAEGTFVRYPAAAKPG